MKTRIISAIVAIILAVVILFFHNTIVFNIAISLFTVIMLYEIFTALKILEFKLSTCVCYVFGVVFPILSYSSLYKFKLPFILICVFALFCTFLYQHEKLPFEKLASMITSTALITFAMNSLITIKLSNEKYGVFLLILSLCGAWLADTGAYFAGTLMGKHKLCPSISPKKTVEGLIGGTITNALLFIGIGLIYSLFQANKDNIIDINYFYIAILGMLCSLIGLLGDLSASLLKRQCGIKDYGNIMPGHGGVLDRFDSILFVVPFMCIATGYFNLIQ